ncbi:TIGR01458 family HAD-type hydrolase [Leptospira ilyithenensis]|uniref:Haloacid dehalogenase-like hydrolase domain-containing protein 2 n=1 Tax=Leptospira ilyithenensis TaxID=2484901 RepID=A0A4R9LKJ8_9LEPT|nr:TIGR01458 family HAD-type hydrolase [Leptospira ilyithenensis]TGN06443.1 TIGR01458 family HAD-type hydrolase [Leptospira ilyithenensis]
MFIGGKKGYLFDLEGVFHQGESLLPGALETLTALREKKIPFVFLTNTTTKSERDIRIGLNKLGLGIRENEILTTPKMAASYLKKAGKSKVRLILADQVKDDITGLEKVEENPEAVIIGDIGDGWSYDLLNSIFRNLIAGSKLIALHKGKFWQTKEGLSLDIGAFITGLEYSAGVDAKVIGKPSPSFFRAGLDHLGLSASDCTMIGDDIESDVGGAKELGIQGILVKTGKFREEQLKTSRIKPDFIIDTIGNLLLKGG